MSGRPVYNDAWLENLEEFRRIERSAPGLDSMT